MEESKEKVYNLVSYSDNEDESSSILDKDFKDESNYDFHQDTMNDKKDNLCAAVTFHKSFETAKN